MAAAATRTPSRSSTHKAAGALLAHGRTRTDAPASPGANVCTQQARKNGHGQHRAGRAKVKRTTRSADPGGRCAAKSRRNRSAQRKSPCEAVRTAASRVPRQTDGIPCAAPNGRHPARRGQASPESPPETHISPLPRARNSRVAGVCSACLHNLIYITNFINVNIPNLQLFFRTFGCHNILSITANQAASHAMRRIYIIQFT